MKKLRTINAEFTVVQKLNQGDSENGLYIVFGCLFLVLFWTSKKERKFIYG